MLSVVQPSQTCQHQNQSANAGGQVAVNHLDPGFAVRDRAARQNGLGLGNLLGGPQRAGAAVAAWPVGAAQARVCQARESTKQDEVKCQKQGEGGQGMPLLQAGVPTRTPPHPCQRCTGKAGTQQKQLQHWAQVVEAVGVHGSASRLVPRG